MISMYYFIIIIKYYVLIRIRLRASSVITSFIHCRTAIIDHNSKHYLIQLTRKNYCYSCYLVSPSD